MIALREHVVKPGSHHGDLTGAFQVEQGYAFMFLANPDRVRISKGDAWICVPMAMVRYWQ